MPSPHDTNIKVAEDAIDLVPLEEQDDPKFTQYECTACKKIISIENDESGNIKSNTLYKAKQRAKKYHSQPTPESITVTGTPIAVPPQAPSQASEKKTTIATKEVTQKVDERNLVTKEKGVIKYPDGREESYERETEDKGRTSEHKSMETLKVEYEIKLQVQQNIFETEYYNEVQKRLQQAKEQQKKAREAGQITAVAENVKWNRSGARAVDLFSAAELARRLLQFLKETEQVEAFTEWSAQKDTSFLNKLDCANAYELERITEQMTDQVSYERFFPLLTTLGLSYEDARRYKVIPEPLDPMEDEPEDSVEDLPLCEQEPDRPRLPSRIDHLPYQQWNARLQIGRPDQSWHDGRDLIETTLKLCIRQPWRNDDSDTNFNPPLLLEIETDQQGTRSWKDQKTHVYQTEFVMEYQCVFQHPDGKVYHNIKKELIDKFYKKFPDYTDALNDFAKRKRGRPKLNTK